MIEDPDELNAKLQEMEEQAAVHAGKLLPARRPYNDPPIKQDKFTKGAANKFSKTAAINHLLAAVQVVNIGFDKRPGQKKYSGPDKKRIFKPSHEVELHCNCPRCGGVAGPHTLIMKIAQREIFRPFDEDLIE